jgi:hypothetical protein
MVLSSYYLNGAGGYQMTDSGLLYALRLCPPIISGSNVLLFGVGGTEGASAVLSKTMVLQTPKNAWTPMVTNQFDAFGIFDFIDRYEPDAGRTFYQFHVPPPEQAASGLSSNAR